MAGGELAVPETHTDASPTFEALSLLGKQECDKR